MARVRVVVIALACVVTAASFHLLTRSHAAPAKGPPPPDAAGPPTSWKSTPHIARVRVDVTPGGASVLHEVVFPKDALAVLGAGEPTLFVAFTAQARPLAVEATRYVLGVGDAADETTTKRLEVIDVPRRPKTAASLLGPGAQSGHVIRLPRDASPFVVRVRSAIATHEIENPTRMVTVMARLGVRDGAPMSIGVIEVGAMLGASIRGARAALCGPGADPRPLTVAFPGYPAADPSKIVDAGTVSPSLVNRATNDDLCIDVLL